MAVFLYQIGIFTAIIIASYFGKKARNTTVILISIFTILQVFMSWLLILQFFTIIIAYSITLSTTKKKSRKKAVPKKREVEFKNRNQELEYNQLDRIHTDNILTGLKAPSKPYEPINPKKDRPNFLSRALSILFLLGLTVILSYMVPFGFLIEWLEKSYNFSRLNFYVVCAVLFTLIQIKYFANDIEKFKKRKQRYIVALEEYNEKIKKYKSDMIKFENRHKSLAQIKMENAELERRMSELKN